MPPESLWTQYSIIGILILAVGIIAAGFYRLWRELLGWIEVQDKKREEERDKQRAWENDQNISRDAQWQAYFKTMQDQWLVQDSRYVAIMAKLAEKIDEMKVILNDHDTWTRARDRD